MDLEEYNKIFAYLKSGELPSGLNSSHARFGFKRKCRSYEIDQDNILWYVLKKKDGSDRRRSKVVAGSIEQAKAVFYSVHYAKPVHVGANRSLQQVSQQYFWPRMTYDVADWIKECPVCSKAKQNEKIKLNQLKVSEPWEIITMNILGPVSETPEGYKFIFTAMDFYSKWVEAFPICNKYPAEVAACLKLIFYRHGAWKSVLSSETSEFVEAVNAELCRQFGGDQHVKTVYHPNVKTLDQRCESDVTKAFMTLVMEHSLDWPHFIDNMLFTMRTKQHPVTKFTPFFLLHKREARMASVVENDQVVSIDSTFDLNRVASNYETSADRDRSAEVRTRNQYFENLKTAQVDQLIENALSQSNAEPLVTVGEKVLMSSSRKRPHDLTKPDSLFTGPYVVTGVKPNKVKIMSIKDNTNVKVVTELERLLPYKETYKLSFFESNPRSEGRTTPTTTLQIITCDNDFNDEDELSEESFQQGADVTSE